MQMCAGGCSFTSHRFERGNNPICYYRVSELAKQGIRELLVQVEAAEGPYDGSI